MSNTMLIFSRYSVPSGSPNSSWESCIITPCQRVEGSCERWSDISQGTGWQMTETRSKHLSWSLNYTALAYSLNSRKDMHHERSATTVCLKDSSSIYSPGQKFPDSWTILSHFFFFFWLHLQHIEVPWARNWTQAEAMTYVTAAAMPDL